MRDLMLMLTAAMTDEMLIEELEKAISEFKISKTPETKKKLQIVCLMCAGKHMVGDDVDGAIKAIKRMDELEARDKLHEPSKQ